MEEVVIVVLFIDLCDALLNDLFYVGKRYWRLFLEIVFHLTKILLDGIGSGERRRVCSLLCDVFPSTLTFSAGLKCSAV